MENKYFTPDIENLCIGYELVSNLEKQNIGIGRVPLRISKGNISHVLSNVDTYEVPYITKEQIEAEGWLITNEGVDSRGKKILYKNCKKELNIFNLKYYLIFNEIEKSLNIYMRKSLFDDSVTSSLYNGNCKDINTFRKLIKLLEI